MTAIDAGPAAGFLRDILADPADDAPRMAYADWLAERGDPRGEFVAVQLRLAALEGDGAGRMLSVAADLDYVPLKWRERELREKHSAEWVVRDIPFIMDVVGLDVFRYRRGFVDRVELTLAAFEAHAAALFAAAPIEGVRLADRRPHRGPFDGNDCWWWNDGGETLRPDDRPADSYLPRWLFRAAYKMARGDHPPPVGFALPSEGRALSVVSAVLAARGRRKAGLPPPPAAKAVARA